MPGHDPAPPPRWLDPDERATWLSLSRVIMKLPSVLDAQLQREAALNYFEYIVLAVLAEQADQTLRMSQLAALTNASLSRLSHVAKRLEGRGYLTRRPDPDDGRYTRATVTPEGLQKVQASAPGHVAWVRALVFDVLTPDQQAQLRTALDTVLTRVDPGSSWPTPPPV